MQYQTPEFDHNFGPYPYQMGWRPEEVSEEDAVVTILQSEQVLFQQPSKITQDDFAGERFAAVALAKTILFGRILLADKLWPATNRPMIPIFASTF